MGAHARPACGMHAGADGLPGPLRHL